MVAADPAEVALRVIGPGVSRHAPVHRRLVLEVAGSHYGECLKAVERHTSCGRDIERRLLVVDREREVHLDPTEGLHDSLKAVEVEFHVVLDGDAEVIGDCGDQLARAFGGTQGGIDLVHPARSGVGDECVPRDRQDRCPVMIGVKVEDHHHVTVDAGYPLIAQTEGGALLLQSATSCRTYEEDVLHVSLRHRIPPSPSASRRLCGCDCSRTTERPPPLPGLGPPSPRGSPGRRERCAGDAGSSRRRMALLGSVRDRGGLAIPSSGAATIGVPLDDVLAASVSGSSGGVSDTAGNLPFGFPRPPVAALATRRVHDPDRARSAMARRCEVALPWAHLG